MPYPRHKLQRNILIQGQLYEEALSTTDSKAVTLHGPCLGCAGKDNPTLCFLLPDYCITHKTIFIPQKDYSF